MASEMVSLIMVYCDMVWNHYNVWSSFFPNLRHESREKDEYEITTLENTNFL